MRDAGHASIAAFEILTSPPLRCYMPRRERMAESGTVISNNICKAGRHATKSWTWCRMLPYASNRAQVNHSGPGIPHGRWNLYSCRHQIPATVQTSFLEVFSNRVEIHACQNFHPSLVLLWDTVGAMIAHRVPACEPFNAWISTVLWLRPKPTESPIVMLCSFENRLPTSLSWL